MITKRFFFTLQAYNQVDTIKIVFKNHLFEYQQFSNVIVAYDISPFSKARIF